MPDRGPAVMPNRESAAMPNRESAAMPNRESAAMPDRDLAVTWPPAGARTTAEAWVTEVLDVANGL
jgi:hypothetical protein